MERWHRLLWTVLFAIMAAALVANAAYELATQGMPSPTNLSAALVAVALAVAWPLAIREGAAVVAPTCRECHGPAFGFGEYGFCIRCGSTRLAKAVAV